MCNPISIRLGAIALSVTTLGATAPGIATPGVIALGATALGVTALAIAPAAWSQMAPATGAKPPAVVSETASYDSLTIAPGAVPSAPAGKTLTLTVDGVETDLAPGTYKGRVVLSVADDVPVNFMALPTHHFRTAVYIHDGAPVASKSVAAAVLSGKVDARAAKDLRIESRGERFNGIVVDGNGAYTIDHPIIDLTGNGGNDFAGFGAAIMATGKAELTVERPIIRTHGAIRTAMFVGGAATVKVNDAEIEVSNGTLPPDYTFTVDVGKMMEVPWMLGLSGNARATNLVEDATVHYNRSHIRVQGWGAMSTDVTKRTRMFVNDSLIEVVDSGYGAYSIGDSVDTFDHSVIRAADIGAIMAAEGSVTFTNGTLVDSGRYGVMMHSGTGGGTLTIDKGSLLRARQTAIQVKGIGTTIVVDDAKVVSDSGVILQAMENDDPFMKAMMSGHLPAGMAAPPPGMGPDGDHPRGSRAPASPDVTAVFRNTAVAGDFYNGRTKQSAMRLSFENATVIGVISTSTTAPATGQEPTRETYREIGHVSNTVSPSRPGNDLGVTLDGRSHWTVTGRSHLSSLTLARGAQLDAVSGHRLHLTVNGKTRPLRAGNYHGAIVLDID